MKILSIVSTKGGSGKSTIASNLAVTAEATGEKVFLLDLDQQGTVANWINRRDEITPAFDRIRNIAQLQDGLKLIANAGHSLVIIDTAGEDDPLVTAAIKASDFCLVPTRPTPQDLETITTTLRAIQAAQKPFAFVLSQTPPRSTRISEAAAGLKMMGLVSPTPIASRADYQDASGAGLGVIEFNPRGKAADEVSALWNWVAEKMKG